MATQTKFEQCHQAAGEDHRDGTTSSCAPATSRSPLRFYVEVLGLQAERVEQWRAGEVRFPSRG